MHTELDLRNIKVQTRLFKIFGIWPQTDRQTYIHTHARAQCSYASVGLAQARPNYTCGMIYYCSTRGKNNILILVVMKSGTQH